MSTSSRNIMRTTAAVVGMAALGAVGTGTAFAATPGLDTAPDAAGHTTLAGAEDGLGTTPEAGGADLHTFQMPTVAHQGAEDAYQMHRFHHRYNHRYDHHRRHHHR